MFSISVENMVPIGVLVDELYAIWSNVPIWGLWTQPGKGLRRENRGISFSETQKPRMIPFDRA